MKERLIQLLDLEQLTPSKFADIIGVQRSSVSHVISERNKPSFDFIQKTLTAFPGLNAEWLILGQGSMYEQMGREATGNLFETPTKENLEQIPEDIPDGGRENSPPEESQRDNLLPESTSIPDMAGHSEDISTDLDSQETGSPEKVVQVMVFYDDDTFRTFKPSK
jgi:transcriptional regulator with XRE-family HTH domain